jgi:hypothetical protein
LLLCRHAAEAHSVGAEQRCMARADWNRLVESRNDNR